MGWSEDAAISAADVHFSFQTPDNIYEDPTNPAKINFDAQVSSEKRERKQTSRGTWEYVYTRHLYILEADLPGDPNPRKIRLDGWFTIEGLEYSILNVSPVTGGRQKIMLQRTTQTEAARPGYRMGPR